MPAYSRYKSGRRQRGLSLVEILVGVLIGMIGIIVIFQVLMVTEQRKRTTTHGSDSQTSGAIALYTMQRELQVAGLGFGTAHTRQLGCTVHVFDAVRPTDNVDFKLVPIEITQGAGGAPDEIAVLWGSPTKFVTSGTAQRSWAAATPDATIFEAQSGGRSGLDWGDILVLTTSPSKAGVTEASTPLTRCALVQVSARPGAVNDVEHNATWESPAPAGVTLPPPSALQATSGEPRYNKATGWPDNLGDPVGWVLNLGKQPRRTVWYIKSGDAPTYRGRLEFLETLANAPGSIVAEGIINMQAEYGIDTNNNNIVDDDEWTVTPPNTATLPPALDKPCTEKPAVSWACVRAIRIALLARSDQWDPTACSPNPQYTSGASGALALANFTMTNLDGTADAFASPCGAPSSASDNDWRRYRYSVYETVIPLRNMIWGTAP